MVCPYCNSTDVKEREIFIFESDFIILPVRYLILWAFCFFQSLKSCFKQDSFC